MTGKKEISKTAVGIVGCDKAATSIIDLLTHDPSIEISFVFDPDPKAPGIILARTHKILILDTIDDIRTLRMDVLLNLTGSVETGEKIKNLTSPDVEVLGIASAKIISTIIDERRKRLEERDSAASERELFLSMGRHMKRIDNIKDAGFAIIDYGASLSAMPASAISLYDKENNEMALIASAGLEGFGENTRWQTDECAATEKVLSASGFGPQALDGFGISKKPDNPFAALGVKSIIAVPLTLNEQLHSIIYLCDFEERIFLREDINSLTLLGVYASLIMDRVKILEKMRHLIVTDGLTGLANQRYFMERLEKEFKRSTRYSHDLSIVIFEIDDFKPYIDKYGHLEGNKLLKELTGLLSESVRETDIAARFGAEKFSILLCEIGKEGAFTFAQRLVERIASYPMPNTAITVSAGVASYPENARGYMQLLSKSEGNLYKAREWGGNRACS